MRAPSWKAYGLVLAVGAAASANTLLNGFVQDDVHVVVQDPRIHTVSLRRILGEPYWPDSYADAQLYRPATSLSLALDWQGGRGSPLIFHAVNLALHLAVIALVLTLAALVLPPAAAAVAALWFAVQPVHVEAVANVVGRAELLAALAYLLAVLAYVAAAGPQASRRRRAAAALAVLACGLVAMGAKEHALTLPAALLLVDAAIAAARRRRFLEVWREHWPAWAASVAAAALFLVARQHAVPVGLGHGQVAVGLQGKNVAQRFVAMLPAYATWARLLAFPLHLSADYSPNALRPDGWSGAHLLGVVAIVAAVAAAWAARRRAPAITLGLAWFAVTASVAANLVVPTGVLAAERTLYLPSVGIAAAIGGAWAMLPRSRWVWAGTAVALLLLGARTVERNTVWRNDAVFFPRLAIDAPDSYRSEWMLGSRAFQRGDAAAGERLYHEALAIDSTDPDLVSELGLWYLATRAYAPADHYLTLAFRMDSTRVTVAVKDVFARLEEGRADSAAALARVVVARWPRRMDVLLVAVQALQGVHSEQEAFGDALRLLALDPGRWELLQIAGDAAARAGACDQARTLLTRAAAAAPPSESAPRRVLARIGAGADCAARS